MSTKKERVKYNTLSLQKHDRDMLRALVCKVDNLYVIVNSFLDDEFDYVKDDTESDELRRDLDEIRWDIEEARDLLDTAYGHLGEILG